MSWGRPRRVAVAPAVVALVVCLAACGSAGSSLSSTVKAYFAALASGDGHTACAQLTPAASTEIVALVHREAPQLRATSCAEALTKVSGFLSSTQRRELRSVRVIDVHIHGTSATAAAKAGGRTSRTYELSKRGQRWLLSGGFIP